MCRVAAFLTKLRNTFTRLSTLPIPTISAVASSAFGGGLELALCTDFRVLASTAVVALPETRLAIIPGAGKIPPSLHPQSQIAIPATDKLQGGTYRLPALIGTARARDMILTGRRVSGPEAYFMGLTDRLVEVNEEEAKAPGVARGKVLGQAVALANDICEGGPVAIRAALQAVNGWRAGEESENKAYEIVLPTADRTEALTAFGEKRKPMFKGR